MKRFNLLSTILLCVLFSACARDVIEIDIIESDKQGDGFSIDLFSSNLFPHQSAAVFGDYCIFVTNKRSSFYLYSLSNRKVLHKLEMIPRSGSDFMGYDLYHCNQASFGVDFYNEQDLFPLLYISQRARNDRRCFIEVFRIEPNKSDEGEDFTSMIISLVQTIYLPVMSETNSLGNVNCVVDRETRKMYMYSRNNDINDFNYGCCKISCMDIPDAHKEEVVLSDSDILDSFMLGCSAINMQGGCILNGNLYIGQGYEKAGYIYMNVINLKKRQLECQVDLLARGVRWEPEGCFSYKNKVMVSTASSIWEFNF